VHGAKCLMPEQTSSLSEEESKGYGENNNIAFIEV